jgi:hypothetical protein
MVLHTDTIPYEFQERSKPKGMGGICNHIKQPGGQRESDSGRGVDVQRSNIWRVSASLEDRGRGPFIICNHRMQSSGPRSDLMVSQARDADGRTGNEESIIRSPGILSREAGCG